MADRNVVPDSDLVEAIKLELEGPS